MLVIGFCCYIPSSVALLTRSPSSVAPLFRCLLGCVVAGLEAEFGEGGVGSMKVCDRAEFDVGRSWRWRRWVGLLPLHSSAARFEASHRLERTLAAARVACDR